MIDSNKSVIIFSHPRSGSTWFQDCLPQYNLSELFNIYLRIKNVDINNGIQYSYSHEYNGNVDKNVELNSRFEIYKQFLNSYGTVSLKIHCHHYNNSIESFLKTLDTQYVLLERRDKNATLWSLLIAWCTLQLHITSNNSKRTQSITISKEVFDQCINILNQCDNDSRIITTIYNPTIIYYEDLLTNKVFDYIVPNSTYIIQNAKEYTSIINLDEVNAWIINYLQRTY